MKNAHNTNFLTRALEFSSIYNIWQNLSGSKKGIKKIIQENLIPFNNSKILDIGCGTGTLIEYMPYNVIYTGYDINQIYIESAKKKYPDRGNFYCTSVNDAIAVEGYFDYVIAIGILHHLNDIDSKKLIQSAAYSLKENGCFISIEPVWTNEQSSIEKFIMKMDRGQNIRNENSYLTLLSDFFLSTESRIYQGIFTIPWTIIVTKNYKK